MRRLIVIVASTLVVSLLPSSAPVAHAECGKKDCRLNADCTWGSICNRCYGPAVIAGGKGECKPLGPVE